MAWETRGDGRRYYFRYERCGGKRIRHYLGNGPLAHLAAQEVAERRERRAQVRQQLALVRDEVAGAETFTRILIKQTEAFPAPPATCPAICVDAVDHPTAESAAKGSLMSAEARNLAQAAVERVQELWATMAAGDQSVLPEIERLCDQHPEIWTAIGDVAQHAVQAWIQLIAGPDPLLRRGVQEKLAALRRDLAMEGSDEAARLLVERVVATWLQVTSADCRSAQANEAALPVREFLARRQQQAQRQHLAALQAWRNWKRFAVNTAPEVPPTAERPVASPPAMDPKLRDMILPFPVIPRDARRAKRAI